MTEQQRRRDITWADPQPTAQAGRGMAGLDFLRAMRDGALPPPPALVLLGIEMTEAEAGRVAMRLLPGEHLYNPLGSMHGGLIATLLDSVMGCAVHSTLPLGRFYTTLEFKVNFLRPITEATGLLTAEGHVIQSGRQAAVVEARVTSAGAGCMPRPAAPAWCSISLRSERTDMRILVLGAGAIGGYFGGRLLAAGRDVTFLVRPRRAAQLAQHGLVVRSPRGDLDLADPPTVQAGAIAAPYDLVLLSCKAYDLEDAIASLAGAVGPDTAILPLLNGMRHLDALDAAFGAAHVLGGQCAISTTLGPDGEVRHLGELHALSFGERDGTRSPRARAIEASLANAGFDARASTTALLDMWEKWVFLASLGAITCLMRAPIGDIVAGGGAALVRQLLEECRATAAAAGHPPRPEFVARTEAMLTAAGSPMTASILRDVESGGRVEADQIVGDLLARHDALTGVPAVVLRAAYVNLKAYEARRARQAPG